MDVNQMYCGARFAPHTGIKLKKKNKRTKGVLRKKNPTNQEIQTAKGQR